MLLPSATNAAPARPGRRGGGTGGSGEGEKEAPPPLSSISAEPRRQLGSLARRRPPPTSRCPAPHRTTRPGEQERGGERWRRAPLPPSLRLPRVRRSCGGVAEKKLAAVVGIGS
ncbi:Os09g0241200 [Oryza sativa Japonica Group]|uniref:Os09g0241200 protein n=2 Tax=Oryza sativa subsp. japonica TaxID=39947 RepID=B7F5J8_ORYSJ|nr:hypothetical protein DAI22_09g015800 [Oryza sativa Japonica Group]BAD36821.1 unknown protein [Oryza sativa Japonica Group]BAF24560.1 Os09g0241200 [Oryza sativa Japonica Group]BAG99895.1 unnamed protein product [Oryza sativa Japonica Group]|eukprot:NP_001062646.1 Os09g0241200 [Oryza sativa Japonica Group]